MSKKAKRDTPYIQPNPRMNPSLDSSRSVAVAAKQQQAVGSLAVLLQMAQNSSGEVQAQIMNMAKEEQKHRHELTTQSQQYLFSLNQEKMKLDFTLQERQQRNIYRTDRLGKVFAFLLFSLLAVAIIYLACLGRLRELTILLSSTALLGLFIKAFTWLMGVNHSTHEGE